MKKKFLATFAVFFSIPFVAQAQTGVRMEVWQNVNPIDRQAIGNNPRLFADNPYMLGNPDMVLALPNFEAPLPPNLIQGNFVARMMASFTIPAGGTFYFWCAANTRGMAWLSQITPNFENRTPLCRSMSQPPPLSKQWLKYPEQRNTYIYNQSPTDPLSNIGNVSLVTGRTYYLMMVLVESDGDNLNHAALGWVMPGNFVERPIPGFRLIPASYPPPPGMIMNYTTTGFDISTQGGSVDLDWLIKNAASCAANSIPIDPVWNGYKSQVSGNQEVSPQIDTTYILTCVPADGTQPQSPSFTITNSYNKRNVTVAWDPNPLQDNVTTYRIYFGTSPGNYSVSLDTGNVTQFTILNDGSSMTSTATYYFALRAVNAGGISNFSDEVSTFVVVP